MYNDNDTITALSTPPGEGGIGIIRISGPKSLDIAIKLFVNKYRKPISDLKNRCFMYGYIRDENGNIADEVLIVYMKSPGTYTREDMIEIHCHGGMIPVNKIIKLIMTAGARLAEPGEFTKRAFLNGRIDLSQAEAVMDLINAKTEAAARISIDQMTGSLSAKIKDLRERLLNLIAHIEVTVDYPEDDIDEAAANDIKNDLKTLSDECKSLLDTADHGRIIREGIRAAIVGKPNVGKSSLLNMLLKENKAIVTDIPGTTRDIIDDYVNIKGVLVNIIDTAGIRHTEDPVESIGVEKSKEMLKTADLILMVVDASKKLDDNDMEIMKQLNDKKTLIIFNKVDLPVVVDESEVINILQNSNIIKTSLKTGTGIEDIKNYIYNMVFEGKLTADAGVTITNNRHKQALILADECLNEAVKGIENGFPMDLVSIDMRNAWNALGEITGDTIEDNLIDRIFSNFCLGK